MYHYLYLVYTPSHIYISPLKEYEKHRQKLESRSLTPAFSEASSTRSLLRGDQGALHVYTDIPHVEEFLTRPEFVISKYIESIALSNCF